MGGFLRHDSRQDAQFILNPYSVKID